MSSRTNTKAATIVALTCTLPAMHAAGDTYVSWGLGFPYDWSASQKWGLDPTCGLYPTRGMEPCCNCGPENRWFVTIDTSIGPRLDVNPDLTGLDHRTGQLTIENHTLMVSEALTIGDGDPLTSAPWIYGPTAGTLVSQTFAHIIDNNALIQVKTFINNGIVMADPGVRFSLQGGGTLTNNPGGLIMLHDDCVVDEWGGRPLIYNLGVIEKLGAAHASVKTDLSGNGVINVLGGSLSLERDSQLDGPTYIAPGAWLKFNGGGFDARVDGGVSGDGSFKVDNGMHVEVGGAFDIEGTLDVGNRAELTFSTPATTHDLLLDDSGGGTFIAGDLTIENWIDWRQGTLKDGSFDILASGLIDRGSFENAFVRIDAMSIIDVNNSLRGDRGGVVLNAGLVRLDDGASLLAAGTNNATFINEGILEKFGSSNGGFNVTLRNLGLFRVSGDFNQDGDFIQEIGETRLDGGTITAVGVDMEFEDGMLTGGGTIAGLAHFHSNAMIAPGLVDDGTGNPVMDELIVHSVVMDPGARSCFKLAGTSKSVDYDTVTGYGGSVYTIGGSLEIRMENGFENAVQQHDMFIIMDSTGTPIAGTFDGITSGQRVPTSNGEGTFIIYYGPTSPFGPNQVCLTGYRRSANNGSGTNAPVGTIVQR